MAKDEEKTQPEKYLRGQCICSTVQFEMADMKTIAHTWCHCESCQRFHSAASAACMLFPIKIEDGELSDTAGKFRVIKGGDKIKRYHHSPDSITRRFFCQDCGSPVFNSIPAMGFVNTFPACFKGAIVFKPEFHSNYAEKIVTVHDGLPKYKGFVGSELVDDEGHLIAN